LILAFIAVFAPQGLWPAIRRLYDKYLAPEAPSAIVAEAPLQPKEGPPEDTL